MNKETVYKELEELSKKFFPETGEWRSSCFKRPTSLSEYAFPCNLYNEESLSWLTTMFKEKFELSFLEENFLKDFINNSDIFKNEKDEYARRIVKWQIEWMINGGEGWIVDPKLGGDFYQFSPKCDIAFRKGIKETLLKIGLIDDIIEEGIETNHEMWRNKVMNDAFINTFEPIFILIDAKYNFKNQMKLNPLLKEYWLKVHEYDYYLEHQESVDKYGSATDAMKMSYEEIKPLKKELKVLVKERNKQLDFMKKAKKKLNS